MTVKKDINRHAEEGRQTAFITVPARLHFGFLDLHGGLGRRFGSIGLALEGIHTRLRIGLARDLTVSGPSAERARRFARKALDGLRLGAGARKGATIVIEEAIPEHAGLGSGTQLALAVGVALARLHGIDLGAREAADLIGRGARSGIGIGAFEQGGVLLDGGNAVAEGLTGGVKTPPPITSRLPFPPEWRVLLIFDPGAQGVHGTAEVKAFESLPPYSPQLAAHLCRLILMTALPALVENDLCAFGRAITELQKRTGDHFASVQGGRFASAAVAEVLSWLESRGVAGIGQSSWGPTGFALIGNEVEARALLRDARKRWAGESGGGGGLQFVLCGGRNRGRLIEIRDMTPVVRDAKRQA